MDPRLTRGKPNSTSDSDYVTGVELSVNSCSNNTADHLAYPLEALSVRWQIYLVIIYTLTAITSFVLNALTVIVLCRCRRSELRKYLINLSMSDLLSSLLSIRKYIDIQLQTASCKLHELIGS